MREGRIARYLEYVDMSALAGFPPEANEAGRVAARRDETLPAVT
jgi:hypothetical protein